MLLSARTGALRQSSAATPAANMVQFVFISLRCIVSFFIGNGASPPLVRANAPHSANSVGAGQIGTQGFAEPNFTRGLPRAAPAAILATDRRAHVFRASCLQ